MNATQYPTSTPTTFDTNGDTVRLPRTDRPAPTGGPRRPVLDAAKLWTGGLASAVIAALVSLVGMLVLRVLAQVAPYGHDLAAATVNPVVLCVGAALAALVATAVAHLLLVSTPSPLAYLGWILGLSTAAAAVLPFAIGIPLATAVAVGLLHLVIGLSIGSLVVNTAATAARVPGTVW
jgi:hypothetical protein